MVIGGMINGKGTSSTELLIDNTHRCYLPEIPEGLYGHSLISTDGSYELESFLMCGGRARKHHYKSCWTFNQGSWKKEPFTLKKDRNDFH